jgi:uncharacterized membrane protein (UPF0182 family)
MVAKSDPGSYGKLEAYVMPAGIQVAGPSLIASEMQSNPAVSAQESLLSQGGSKVLRGNIVMLPIGESIIAVRPLYVQGQGQNAFPQLRKVIVWHAGEVRMDDTLQGALAAAFGNAPPTQEQGPSTPGVNPPPSTSVSELLALAEKEFAAADESLRAGDLAGYQQHNAKGREYAKRAHDASNAQSTPSSATTTTAKPATSA